MDIVEARTLLGISEYADTEEIQFAQDRIIDQAYPNGDLSLLRKAARAVAALFVEGGHCSQEQADRYVAHMDAFYSTQVGEIDQRTARIRDIMTALTALGPSSPAESESLEEAVARRLADDPQYQAALAHIAERQALKAARKQRRAELLHNAIRTITFRR